MPGGVGRSDDEDHVVFRDAVELGEEGVDDEALVGPAPDERFPARSERVYLVEEEDDALLVDGDVFAGLLEDAVDVVFGLACVAGDEVAAARIDEGPACFAREGLGEIRLAAARRPVEEDARGDALLVERREFRVGDGVEDVFAELFLDVFEAADVVKREVAPLEE